MVEHWSRKPGVVSSILTGGSDFVVASCVHQSLNLMLKNLKPRKKEKKTLLFNNYFVFQHVDLKFCMVIVFFHFAEDEKELAADRIQTCAGRPHY